MSRTGIAAAVSSLLGLVLAAGLTATAAANKSRPTKADVAAAKSALLKLSDLPAPFTWTGGKVTVSAGTSSFSCKGFHPKSSDLVTTGAAAATFTAQGVQLVDDAELLRTTRMVQLDFHRTFVSGFLPCLVSNFKHGLTGIEVLKASRLSLPRDAKLSAAYRILFTITPKGKAADHGAFDYIALGVGRKELSLSFTALFGSAADEKTGIGGMTAIDENLAALLARRASGASKSTAKQPGTIA